MFTPQEVAKVAEQVISTQKANGYKPGWVKFEMENRAAKVSSKVRIYRDLANQVFYVANGEQTMNDLQAYLNNCYEQEQRYAQQYGG